MKYLNFIFENQDVRNTVVENEAIVEIASNALINANIVLEDYVYENLARFTVGADSLADIYENIRNFVISENVALYSQYSEILSDNELTNHEKSIFFEISLNGIEIAPALYRKVAKELAKEAGGLANITRGQVLDRLTSKQYKYKLYKNNPTNKVTRSKIPQVFKSFEGREQQLRSSTPKSQPYGLPPSPKASSIEPPKASAPEDASTKASAPEDASSGTPHSPTTKKNFNTLTHLGSFGGGYAMSKLLDQRSKNDNK